MKVSEAEKESAFEKLKAAEASKTFETDEIGNDRISNMEKERGEALEKEIHNKVNDKEMAADTSSKD